MRNYLNMRGKILNCSTPQVMGILNLTPDSFFEGSRVISIEDIIKRAGQMLNDGATILDIGGQSTRPGAELLSPEEEWNRIDKPLHAIREAFPDAILSIDTFYGSVAEKAINAGADMINDVSGGSIDAEMFATVAKLRVPYVLMHLRGTPKTMQQDVSYENVVTEVLNYFIERILKLNSLGVADILLDPGFGFAKNLDHNYELLSRLNYFKILERPLLVGLSRKSMVNKVVGTKPEDALNGTTVLHTLALQKGASILRVHDVKEAVEAIQLVTKFQSVAKQ